MSASSQRLIDTLREHLTNRDPDSALDAIAAGATAREAVVWGCRCGWSLWRPQPPAAEDAALALANRWVWQGSDELRLQADEMAKRVDAGLTRWLLSAVVHSGGTICMPGETVPRPTPDRGAPFVVGFVRTLLARCDARDRPRQAMAFVSLACQTLEQTRA